jgi:hypothetical protein
VGHAEGDTLGVREGTDITPTDGLVHPGTGGMSVSPSKEELPDHLIPKRLRHEGYPGARRSNARPDTFPWRMGEGDWCAAPLCDRLSLRPDPEDPECHGFVEPDRPMPLAEHRGAVAATWSAWVQEQW